ncbi:DUF1045 domain-containing protein [Plastorhodobacter daqingensis]|uniref:DUF1045 domain-containing protein n=1 Tax=Plastorhodobacter daqingensis TaxID=1387281 RepID=A0ABW2UHW0_9RHOB
MTEYERYAIYYLPDPGPLADFGAAWLGWDVQQGRTVPHPDVDGLPVADLTATPRKYGLHATIKPPFRLAPGHDAPGLSAALDDLCARLTRVELPGLVLARLGSFLALRPEGDQSHLAALAAQVVMELDAFRAPPSEAELARRKAAGLDPRQIELLERWGYPYVMEEFHFHITLTGKLDAAVVPQVEAALQPRLVPLLPRPFRIDSLCLLGEREGRFHLVHRYTLSG